MSSKTTTSFFVSLTKPVAVFTYLSTSFFQTTQETNSAFNNEPVPITVIAMGQLYDSCVHLEFHFDFS